MSEVLVQAAPQAAGSQEPEPKAPVVQRPTVRPLVDLLSGPEGWVLVADLPGVSPHGLNVTVEGGSLLLEAAWSDRADEARTHAAEFRPVDYRRRFTIPDGVDAEAIQASLADGVLTLTLPRPKAQVRRVPVTVA